MRALDTLDWIFIGLYFLVLAGIVIWVLRKKHPSNMKYSSLVFQDT